MLALNVVEFKDVYNDLRFIRYCKTYAKSTSLHEDLLQHCLEICYIKNKTNPFQTMDDLFKYFKTVVFNQYAGERSTFSKQYATKKETTLTNFNSKLKYPALMQGECFEYSECLKTIDRQKPKTIKEFVQSELFELYLKNGSVLKVCKITGFCRSTVNELINDYKKQLSAWNQN